MSLRVAATPEGAELEVGRRELAVLESIPGFLATVGAADDDPAVDRLFPVAYPDEDDDREFRRFSGAEIERGREEDRRVFAEVLERLEHGRAELTPGETESCVRAIGAARLAIAARHGMFDMDELDQEPSTPHATIVAFLGYVQDELVNVLMEAMEMRS